MSNSSVLTYHPEGATGQRFEARTALGHTLQMDSGDGAVAASPVDVVLAALGSCSGMDVIAILRKQRQDVVSYEVRLESERRTEHPRIFTRIEVRHIVRGRGISEAALKEAIRLSDTKYCTVHAILHASAEIHSSYEIVEL